MHSAEGIVRWVRELRGQWRAALDANVIVALWDWDPHLSSAAQSALDAALGGAILVTTATVFAGLMAGPPRSESFLDSFFREPAGGHWALGESVWRTAGRAFQGYAARRRKQRDAGPRRILADFLIGVHARRPATDCSHSKIISIARRSPSCCCKGQVIVICRPQISAGDAHSRGAWCRVYWVSSESRREWLRDSSSERRSLSSHLGLTPPATAEQNLLPKFSTTRIAASREGRVPRLFHERRESRHHCLVLLLSKS